MADNKLTAAELAGAELLATKLGVAIIRKLLAERAADKLELERLQKLEASINKAFVAWDKCLEDNGIGWGDVIDVFSVIRADIEGLSDD